MNVKEIGKAVGYADSITLQRYLNGLRDRVPQNIVWLFFKGLKKLRKTAGADGWTSISRPLRKKLAERRYYAVRIKAVLLFGLAMLILTACGGRKEDQKMASCS